jgi:hypothetical protein
MEVDITDILNEEFSEKDILDRIKKDKLPSDDLPDKIDSKNVTDIESEVPRDISDLCGRLKTWHENCRDLLVDLRTVNYEITEDDTYIEFKDKNYYEQRLYFKVDLQNPKDAKVVHATKQLCKIIGIPYTFFAANRPSLKKNIVRTWQAGLVDDVKKSQNVFKIRESKACTIIRAVTPTTKSFIPLYELIQIIKDSLNVPFKLEEAYGDEKDDLVFHARFIFEKEYTFNGPICLGFSITASELDACPLSIDVLLYNKISKTNCIALYGGESFFKSDYKGLQSSSLKEILPLMLTRFEDEIPEILSRLDKKQRSYTNSVFCVESDAMEICKAKGMTSSIKKAIYHQISECIEDISSPWDLAMHVGLVAKDFEILKRVQIEKAIGIYLNLFFSEGVITNDTQDSE